MTLLVQRDLSDSAIVPYILSIHIAGHSPSQQGVIESGIELAYILPLTTFHLDTSQHLVPKAGGFAVHLVKAKSGRFGIQIQARIFQAGVGESHLHLHHFRFAGGEKQIKPVPDTPGCGGIGLQNGITEYAHCFGLLCQAGHKIHFYPVSGVAELGILGVCFHESLHLLFSHQLSEGLCHIAALTLLMTYIEDNTRTGRFGKGITMIANTLRSSKFYFQLVILQ